MGSGHVFCLHKCRQAKRWTAVWTSRCARMPVERKALVANPFPRAVTGVYACIHTENRTCRK